MSRTDRPHNTNRKRIYLYIILATSGGKGGFFEVQKKKGKDNNKKQGFIVEKNPKYRAFYRKVGKLANIVRDFLEENHAFLWVFGPKN